VASVLAVLAASAGAFAYYFDRIAVPTPASARWFSHGPRWSVATEDGKPQMVSSQVSTTGTEPLEAMGLSAANAVRDEMGRHRDPLMWTAVSAVVFANGNHLSVPEVFVASDDGVVQMVGYAGVLLPAVYEPAMTVLPADPRSGDSWSQRGKASWRSNKLASYQLESMVTALTAEGCVDVRTRLRLIMSETGSSIGGEDSDDVTTTTYCPGDWVTSADGELDTEAVTADLAEVILDGFRTPAIADLEESTEAETELFPRGFGSSASADALVVPEAGIVVDADRSSNSVSGYVWDSSYPAPQWTVPGQGPFLANPVSAGDSVVVADTHGTVTALDAVSGFVHWQRPLGRLPMRLTTDETGRYVGVLDRSGSAWLIDVPTGDVLATAPIGAPPVGIAVLVHDEGPMLVVADETALRAYRPDGDDTEEVYRTAVEVSAGPAVHGTDVLVATQSGELVAVGPDGRDRRRYVADYGLERLVVGGHTVVGIDGDDAYFIAADDLHVVAVVHDDADALTVGWFGVEPVFTLTAHDGRVTVRTADGTESRTVQAPVVGEPPPGYGDRPVPAQPQLAAAVSVDHDVWVPALTGPIYYGSLS
jgi:hypothetical protein